MNIPHSSWANWYDAVYENAFGEDFLQLTHLTLEQVGRSLPPPARIVDFGAGTGRMALPLAARGYEVAAVEPCQAMLDQLVQKAGGGAISAHACRMQDFQCMQKYDMALCVFTVLIYIVDDAAFEKSIRAAADALVPGGLFLLDIPLRPLFQSNHIQTQDIDRDIHIRPLGGSLYHYREVTTLPRAGENVSFTEEFEIRCWGVQYVKKVLADCGFSMKEDLTNAFFRWGAKYLLMQKTG